MDKKKLFQGFEGSLAYKPCADMTPWLNSLASKPGIFLPAASVAVLLFVA